MYAGPFIQYKLRKPEQGSGLDDSLVSTVSMAMKILYWYMYQNHCLHLTYDYICLSNQHSILFCLSYLFTGYLDMAGGMF